MCVRAPKRRSEPVYKVIASAVSFLERTDNPETIADLYVSQAFVDQGITLRRIHPRAHGGSASRILKRSSPITVVVEPRTERETRGQATTRSEGEVSMGQKINPHISALASPLITRAVGMPTSSTPATSARTSRSVGC